MMLMLTAIDLQGKVRTFSYEVSHVKQSFDILSDIAARGHFLVRAQLIEDSRWTYLPVEAFDGKPVSPVTYALEKEWEQVLDKPLDVRSIFNRPDNDNGINQVGMTSAHCIIYFSSSVGLLEEKELISILHQSRQHNRQMDITGILLYVQGRIVQVLEGQQEVIEALFARIQQDRRHTDVTCVVNQRIKERLFIQWSMGYETLTVCQFDEIKAVVNLESASPMRLIGQPTVLQMIKAFYEINRLN